MASAPNDDGRGGAPSEGGPPLPVDAGGDAYCPGFVGPRLEHEQPATAEGLEDDDGALLPGFEDQARRMPAPVRRLLLGLGADLPENSPKELIDSLRLPEASRAAAEAGLAAKPEEAMLQRPAALSADACAKLRAAVDGERQSRPDSVDGQPDQQRNFTRGQLEHVLGAEVVAGLFALPGDFLAATGSSTSASFADAEIFVRRYTVGTRPWNPFHTDSAAVTVNVALVGDDAFEGGRLLACYDGAVREIARGEGEATVHASTLLHGVSAMRSGVRYSLIMFFGNPEDKASDFTAASREAEADALRALMADAAFRIRCAEVLGVNAAEETRGYYERLAAQQESLGAEIERVVLTYAAPHLRPSHIRSRDALCQDSSCWSVYNLLKYAAHRQLARSGVDERAAADAVASRPK